MDTPKIDKKFINGWSYRDGTVGLLWKENNQKQVKEFKPSWYFYVDNNDKAKDLLYDYFKGSVVLNVSKEGEYLKVKWGYENRDRIFSILKSQDIPTYEADLTPLDLYVLDHNLEIEDSYRILYFDIETDDTTGEVVVGRDTILSMAWYDDKGESGFICENTEKQTLQKIVKVFDDYDIIIGWNSYNFDLPYIKERLYKHKIKYEFKTIVHVDLMKRFIKIGHYKFALDNFRLDTIAKFFIGEGKIVRDKKIKWMFENDREKLKEYNLKDCELLYKLDKAMSATHIMILESCWCRTFLKEFYVSKLLDMYILRRAREVGKHYPTKPEHAIESDYEGALVLDPGKGIFDNVYVLDFKSLYPSIIMTFNISSDVQKKIPTEITEYDKIEFHDLIKTVNGLYFEKYHKGLVTDIIIDLLAKRKEIKDQLKNYEYRSKQYESVRHQQDAVKELTNSIYGILGDSRSRYFNPQIAESITLAGQWLTKEVKTYLNTKGMDIVYGDTDSLFVWNNGNDIDTVQLLNDIQLHLDTKLRSLFNINENYVSLEYEKKLSKAFFVSKKRYAQRIIEAGGKPTDFVEIVGLECRKSDTIGLAKEWQRQMIEGLLGDLSHFSADYWHSKIETNKIENLLNKKDISIEDITIRQKLTKRPDQYTSSLPHVEIAKRMLENKEEFYLGMSIEYFVLSAEKKIVPEMTCNYNGEFDRVYYWNNRIYPCLERVLASVFPNENWAQHYIEKEKKSGRKKQQKDLFSDDSQENKEV